MQPLAPSVGAEAMRSELGSSTRPLQDTVSLLCSHSAVIDQPSTTGHEHPESNHGREQTTASPTHAKVPSLSAHMALGKSLGLCDHWCCMGTTGCHSGTGLVESVRSRLWQAPQCGTVQSFGEVCPLHRQHNRGFLCLMRSSGQ